MSLLQALDDEQREVLKDLEEQKKNKKGPAGDQNQAKDEMRTTTLRLGDNRPKGAMSAVYGRSQLPDPLARASARRNSTPEISGLRLPLSSSLRRRAASPGSSLLSPTHPNPPPNMRRRSENNLSKLTSLGEGAVHSRRSKDNGDDTASSHTEKDKNRSNDLDDDGEESSRGRGRERSLTAASVEDESESRSSSMQSSTRLPKDPNRKSQSPRTKMYSKRIVDAESTSKYKTKSSVEPTLTVTGPDDEKAMNKKAGVHPNTSFDQGGGSGVSTPINSDTEADITDIRRAQKMALTVSPIHSTPEAHRVIRQIIRGQYSTFQREAEQGLRRQRVYLVATDLSEEAAHALEWTIGTVLRDGDTLLAVYAVDEELGTGGETSSVGIGEGASVVKDTASIVGSFPTGPDVTANAPGPSPLANAGPNSPGLETSTMSKAERERYHAATEVTDRCIKLLRKTRLQVRVVVEVFHCKSPKHMITEVVSNNAS